MHTKTQAVTSDAFVFPCPRRAMPIKPSKPETNSQTAAGIGTATSVPISVPNENTTLEMRVLAVTPANASVKVTV